MTNEHGVKSRIDDIEVLRGCAVLLVVLHHAHGNLITWRNPVLDGLAAYINGWYGVDLFFAISGFVIARTLLPKLEACRDREDAFRITVSFWIRRAWRLLPSAWLWLLIILVASRLFNTSEVFGTWKANFEATIAGVLQIANIRFVETFGQSEYGASFVYWSLSLEEQFYLCFPLVALLFRRWLPLLLALLIALQIFATRDLTLIVFRSDALMLGILLAIASRRSIYQLARPAFLERLPGKGTLPLLAIVLCMGVIGSQFFDVISYKHTMIALLSAILVWIASYDRDLLLTPKPLRPVMIWAGARSYGIYLIHIPVFLFTREIWFRLQPESIADSRFTLPIVATALVLLLIVSELNYRMIESPFRRFGTTIADNFLSHPYSSPTSRRHHAKTTTQSD